VRLPAETSDLELGFSDSLVQPERSIIRPRLTGVGGTQVRQRDDPMARSHALHHVVAAVLAPAETTRQCTTQQAYSSTFKHTT